jgi:hypothetical protein
MLIKLLNKYPSSIYFLYRQYKFCSVSHFEHDVSKIVFKVKAFTTFLYPLLLFLVSEEQLSVLVFLVRSKSIPNVFWTS